MVNAFLTFWGLPRLLSKVTAPAHNPIAQSEGLGYPPLHHCLLFITCPSGHSHPSTISISISYWLCWASFHVFFGYLSIFSGVIFRGFLVKFSIGFLWLSYKNSVYILDKSPISSVGNNKGLPGNNLGGSRDTAEEYPKHSSPNSGWYKVVFLYVHLSKFLFARST